MLPLLPSLLNDKKLTSDGHEVTIASHLISGSYLLSKLLLPKLQNAVKDNNGNNNDNDQPRVIYVSSGGMYNTKFPNWEEATNQKKYDGVMAYSYAKRGQILLAEQLAKRYPEIKWLSCHPGWVDTNAVDEAFGPSGKKIFSPLRNTWEGSEGIAWLMGTNGMNLVNGGFYLDRNVEPKHMAGPFMTEGKFTKNSDEEIEDFMEKLYETVGI